MNRLRYVFNTMRCALGGHRLIAGRGKPPAIIHAGERPIAVGICIRCRGAFALSRLAH